MVLHTPVPRPHSRSCMLSAALFICYISLASGHGKKGWKTESPEWANRGNGKKDGKKGMHPRRPPQESFDSCINKVDGDDCSWMSPRSHMVYGNCKLTRDGSNLHCPPAHGKGKGKIMGEDKEKEEEEGRGKGFRDLNSSVDACRGKEIEQACAFRPPVFGDQEAEGFKGKRGNLGKGKQRGEDWKDRRGPKHGGRSEKSGICVPMQQTDGSTTTSVNFCRVLPPQRATDACNESMVDDKCSFLTNGTDTYIHLQVMTGQQDQAETKGDILASFFVHGEWTDPELFIAGGSAQGETNSKVFVLAGWPMKVSLTTWSNDAWCFWKVIVNDTIILEDPKGPTGSDVYMQETDTSTFKDSRYWIEGPPSSQIFDVPEDSTASSSDQQSLTLRIYTSSNVQAGTKGSVFASFFANGEWTEEDIIFTGAESGEEKSKVFTVSGWPEKIWIGTDSSDPYSYEKITINQKEVIEDPSGFGGNSQAYDPLALGSFEEVQQFWIASPPSSQTFGIPRRAGLPEERHQIRHKILGSCQETWWDVLEGTLHCRPRHKSWTPGFNNPRHQGNKSKPNAMEPDFVVKSDAETSPIKVQMVISNLDYNKLQQDAAALSELREKTKALVAASAGDGVYPHYVTVEFLPGSVIASCEVNPPAYVSRNYVQQNLKSDTNLQQALADAVTSIPAVAAMTTGAVIVSAPTIVVVLPTTSAQESGNDDDNIITVLIVVSIGSVACAVVACMVACVLWRKVQGKGRNPQINGTTVAVGRPVVPGSNDVATTGIPVVAETVPDKEATKTDVPSNNNDFSNDIAPSTTHYL